MIEFVLNDFSIVLTIIGLSVIGSVLTLILFWVLAKKIPKDVLIHFLMIVSISTLGAIAGFSGGMSRVGVVGEIVPAALSLIGGLSLYMFGVQRVTNILLPISISIFAVTLLLGFSFGANNREKRQTFELLQERCLNLFMNHELMEKSKLTIAMETHGKTCGPIMQETFSTVISIGAK